MSKSAIYTTNQSVQAVAINGVITPGTVIRRFGCNIALSGNGLRVEGEGYYKFDTSITLAPTAAGDVTVTAYKDGVAISGAIASGTAAVADDIVNLGLDFIIREGCPCCDGGSNITFVLTGTAANVTNIAITGEKL